MSIVNALKICLALTVLHLLASACESAVIDGNRIMDQRMNENLCALTFDDGPSRYTEHLLDMLRDYGIPATFFLLGSQVERNPATARRILDEGHEIGNHSWSHANLRALPTQLQEREIRETDAALRAIGASPAYLRPPYGNFDSRTIEMARDLGLDVILWSMDSKDWKHLPENYARLRTTRGTQYDNAELRGIFLFHDTHKSTVDDLPRIIANLLAGGCNRFVTVSDYLAAALDPEPPLVMRRNPRRAMSTLAVQHRQPPRASEAAMPLARCSRPWDAKMPKTSQQKADAQAASVADGDAHAADDSRTAAEI